MRSQVLGFRGHGPHGFPSGALAAGARRAAALTVAAALAAAVAVIPGNSAQAAACPSAPAPQVPDNPAYYTYVSSYDSACSSTQNWTRNFPDATVSTVVDGSVPVSVTTSTALGGAIASLTVAGKQYIASGGHGSALQYDFHAWNGSSATGNECYNPTQAGARVDDAGHTAPWHGPSTSALYQESVSGATIQTQSRPAMFITRSDTGTGADPSAPSGTCHGTDYQPDISPYTYGLSPYWLTTSVTMNAAGLANVIGLSATLTSGDSLYQHFDGVVIAYLQHDFTANYIVDPETGTASPVQANTAYAQPTERCTADGAYCLGLYYRPAAMPGAYYYLQTGGPDAANGGFGEYTTQITVPTSNISSGSKLHYQAYLIVGNVQRVATTIQLLAQKLGQTPPLSSSTGESPGRGELPGPGEAA